MHEMSLALEVCRLAEERLGTAGSRRLRTVGLELGQAAGIECENLEFCLDAILAGPPFGAARTAITPVAGDDLRLTFLEVDDDGPDD
jgi:Zn finger protein HypA/HybF involved in hydrogenase expression